MTREFKASPAFHVPLGPEHVDPPSVAPRVQEAQARRRASFRIGEPIPLRVRLAEWQLRQRFSIARGASESG